MNPRDAFTTSSDFIISPHAAAKGLFVATCGSFHGYKFFPVLGKYVVQMLEDELEPELKEKWAWDRERPAPSLNPRDGGSAGPVAKGQVVRCDMKFYDETNECLLHICKASGWEFLVL